jgi:hypothetical protein
MSQLRTELLALLSELLRGLSSLSDQDGSQRLLMRAMHWRNSMITAVQAGAPVLSP